MEDTSNVRRYRPSLASLGVSRVSELIGHDGCVNCLTWSRDGNILFSGSDDRRIGMWTVDSAVSGRGGACSLHFQRTAHGGNIFDVALFPQRHDGASVSVAMDGTACCNDPHADVSRVLYDVSDDSSAPRRTARDVMALQCSFVPDCPSAVVISVSSELKLLDLRSSTGSRSGSSRGAMSLHTGRVFAFIPPSSRTSASPLTLLVASGATVGIIDLRMVSAGYLEKFASSSGNEVSGLDVSSDGEYFALSEMAGPVTVIDRTGLVGGSSFKFGNHVNEETFLKKPKFFFYENGWCVAHGSDTGDAFFYEMSSEAVSTDRETVQPTPLVPDLCAFPRLRNRRRIHVIPGADSRVCNVVCPHPTLLAAQQRPTTTALPIMAMSGIDQSIKLVEVVDDNCPRFPATTWQSTNMPSGKHRLNSLPVSLLSGTSWSASLPVLTQMKACATKAMLSHNRNVFAQEVYSELAMAAVDWHQQNHQKDASSHVSGDAAEVVSWIAAMFNNAAMAALRANRFQDCVSLSDAVLHYDSTNAKALFRKASALRAQHNLEDAFAVAQQASNLTQMADAAVEQLCATLKQQLLARKQREKARMAKLFA